MKRFVAGLALASAALLSGCAAPRSGLVLAPVGPSVSESAPITSPCTLVVFSAYDPLAHFNRLPERYVFTDYTILSDNGQLLQKVQNDRGGLLGEPKPVELSPGRYRVVARANGYGTVTVPVVIVAHQTTRVHLEGANGEARSAEAIPAAQTVRLPRGEFVGLRAPDSPF